MTKRTYLWHLNRGGVVLWSVILLGAAQLSSLPAEDLPKVVTPSLVQAAQVTTPAVVHIKATYQAGDREEGMTPFDQLFREFFGERAEVGPGRSQPRQAAGSGVLIATDGYIITNNHVISGADQIEVTLDDNRKYQAQLIGKDPATDLALLKIKANDLPFLEFGNSDTLQVGEWVLAVGNPFNLTSTVTKGIVSAKARRIDAPQHRDKMSIEAFIQTDAAINAGNSGGALVNLRGELVGINTAIATHTGSFSGYSFAIPSSIVQKVAMDLKQYGVVQRAMLGIVIGDVNADLAKKENLGTLSGVYVNEVNKDGAAAKAGMKPGDVIVALNGQSVTNVSQLQERMAKYKPDDVVQLTYARNGKAHEITVTLEGLHTSKKLEVLHQEDCIKMGGATFEHVDEATRKRLDLDGGIRVKSLERGPWYRARVPRGFIITTVDGESIGRLEQLAGVLNLYREREAILVGGYMPKGRKMYFAVRLGNQ